MKKTEDKEFIEKLLDFLDAGLQDPIQIISYLQSRNKCKQPNCKIKCCKTLIPYFSGKKVTNFGVLKYWISLMNVGGSGM